MIRKILLLFTVMLCGLGAFAADYPSRDELEKRSFTGSGGTVPYRLFIPKNYDPGASYPLVVFLHGSGEAGNDNESQLKNNGNGSLWLINTEYQQSHPMFFCAPQATTWGDTKKIKTVRELVESLEEEFPGIDPDRIIVTGISNGGTGTYLMLANHPDILAGAVPMQGPSSVKTIANHKTLNIWHFHAANDATVYPIGPADYGVKYLRSHGLKVVYTRYDTGGHGIWPVAYKTPQLIDWIYNVRRGKVYTGSPFAKILTKNGEDFTTNTNTVSLSGISGDNNLQVSEVKYFNTQSSAYTGTCEGTMEWSVSNIPLRTGVNNIMSIAYGTSWWTSYGGNTSVNDTVNITYDPDYIPVDPNNAPVIDSVYANPDTITLPDNTVNMSVMASDADEDTLTYSWSKTSGVGDVSFDPENSAESLATFSESGTYEISVTVSDGKDVVSKSISVIVNPQDGVYNNPPVITAVNASATEITLPDDSVVITSSATDSDGDSLSYAWSLVSGPADVVFTDDSSSSTQVAFLMPGVYTLSLTVSDGNLTAYQTINVTVNQQPVTELTNVALNKPASANSYLDENKYPASKAVDGNSSDSASRWLSADDGNQHWIVIDLQDNYEISSMKMRSGFLQHGYAIANYDLQILNGDEWVSVVTVRDNTEQYKEHSFDACVTNKVRLLCGNEDLARLYELEVYGTTAQVEQEAQNVVLHKPVTANSYYDEDKYPASNAVDGDSSNVNSRWLSDNDGKEHLFDIDLQGEYTVSKASLWMGYKTAGYAIKNYKLQVWDGNVWQSVVTVTDNNKEHVDHDFTPVTTTKIRLLCGSDDLARLYEIEVMGVAAK